MSFKPTRHSSLSIADRDAMAQHELQQEREVTPGDGRACTHGDHDDHHHEHHHGHGHDSAAAGAEFAAAAAFVDAPLPQGQTRSQWLIEEMDCPTEERLLRKRLEPMAGVEQLQFQLMRRTLLVQHEHGLEPQIEQAIKELGLTPVSAEQEKSRPTNSTVQHERQRQQLLRISVAVGFALVAELGSWWQGQHWAWFVLALVAILLSGGQVYRKGWVAIKNKNLNINALMSIAVTGAVLIGEWPEAAMVMSLFALAEWIEARSLARARHAVEQLLSIAPDHVHVWFDDEQVWREQPTAAVPSGSLIRVRPGERIALDGVVEQGQSEVNQAPITGESMAVAKSSGAFVYAGSINGMAELLVRTQGGAEESTLARIAQAVQEAQQGKAALERFVDRFARVYTPIVVLMAIFIAVLPPLVGWLGWYEAAYKALVLLVIACPCALVISTPVAVVSGLAVAARHGILIKGGAYLERVRGLSFLALDKTGTLTSGRPQLTDYALADAKHVDAVLGVAHYLASRSDHPSSMAISQGLGAQASGVASQGEARAADFEALPGRGVQSTIDGVQYKLGQLYWAVGVLDRQPKAEELLPDALKSVYHKGCEQGASFVYLSANDKLQALFLLQDTLKPGVAQSLDQLKARGVQLAILSGDTRAAVAHVANQLGIDHIYGDLLPAQKLELVRARRQHHVVGMVGDGINDAPALAEADIGFAMGSLGSDMAIETADVAIMNDELGQMNWLMQLSQRLHTILTQNIGTALGIKAIFLVWAVFGQVAMWMAVFADVGASLLVVLNSLRLLQRKSA